MGKKFKSMGETQEASGTAEEHARGRQRRLGQGAGGEGGMSQAPENSRAGGHHQIHRDIRVAPLPSETWPQSALQVSLPSTSAKSLADHKCVQPCFLILRIPFDCLGHHQQLLRRKCYPKCTLQL